MAQATNREAMTIAVEKVAPAQIEIGSVVVIDEMSMVDVLLMYRLLRHLPVAFD
jgi:exodeoxyribonuclease V alpha subunit